MRAYLVDSLTLVGIAALVAAAMFAAHMWHVS